jgi:hypothetical protein
MRALDDRGVGCCSYGKDLEVKLHEFEYIGSMMTSLKCLTICETNKNVLEQYALLMT